MVICPQFVNRAAGVGTLREGEDVCEHHTWEAGGAQGPVTGPGSGEELGRGGKVPKICRHRDRSYAYVNGRGKPHKSLRVLSSR